MQYTIKRGGAYDRFRMMLEGLLERQCEIHCLSLTPIQVNHPLYRNHVVDIPSALKRGFMAKVMTVVLFPVYGLLTGWREKVDLCIAFGPLYASLQALPKCLLRRPMVTFVRSDLGSTCEKAAGSRLIAFIQKMVDHVGLLFSDRIITVNAALRERILGTFEGWKRLNVDVLFNNSPEIALSGPAEVLQTRTRYQIPGQAKIIVTAGFLTPAKNPEVLLKSVSKIARDDLFLVIAGDTHTTAKAAYQDALRKLIDQLGLGQRVVLTGWLEKEDLWNLFKAADLFVLPSYQEGMPNALLEALSCETPCFGSRLPGIRDILQEDDLLFDPSDEDALARKIDRFMSDAAFSEKVSRICLERKRALSFDWKAKMFELVTQGMAGREAVSELKERPPVRPQ